MPSLNGKLERSTMLALTSGQRAGGSFLVDSRRFSRQLSKLQVSLLAVVMCGVLLPANAQTIKLQQAGGGVAITGAASPFSTGFGNVNGLGIGNAQAGLTVISVAGGYFYYTPYTMVLSGSNGGHPAKVSAYISTNFSNPTSVIKLMSCAYPGPCTTFASYTAMPTTQAGEIVVLPQQTSNGNYTAYLGLFVADFNGAITTPDTARINFDTFDSSQGTTTTVQLRLNNPSVTIETALQLQLGTSTGLSITATGSSPDYTTNFGTVNGLGIGAGAGITVVNGQVANGALYTTPYLVKPAFSGFTSSSSTKITTYVSTNFVHSAILKLYDSGTSNSGYGLISTNSGAPTTISSTVTNGTNITRYLGLFVSNANGAGSFTGSDSATLTYTLTVQ